MNESRLEYLFRLFLDKKISVSEKDELLEMLSHNETEDQAKALIEKAWKEMPELKPVFSEIQSKTILENILQSQNRSDVHEMKPQRHIWRSVAAAAVIAVLTVAAIYLFNQSNKRADRTAQNIPVGNLEIRPGGDKAYLTLADGSTILLDTTKDGTLMVQGGMEVIKTNGTIVYEAGERNTAELVYNTISTPIGGQYQVVLSDGTKVWLNAASSLRFPAVFTGTERNVTLKGEAYFEVAKDRKKPFHVITSNGMNVEVVGTGFNVMAYDDESDIKTTLVEGEVKVTTFGSSIHLLPMQQAVLNKSTESLTKSAADVEEAIAWKDGRFYFNDENIVSIMRKLSRWYNVEVIYNGTVPSGHYAGSIKRQAEISQVLKMLELPGGIAFKVDGNKIIVTSK